MLPVGLGIGATQVAWFVMSPTRAAGILPIRTVIDPFMMMPGPAGTHVGSMHGAVISVTRAAGAPPIKTFGCPLIMARGRAGCGTGVGTGAGGWIGAWQCGTGCRTWSPIRAAGWPIANASVNWGNLVLPLLNRAFQRTQN
jgi:hypothetical protein